MVSSFFLTSFISINVPRPGSRSVWFNGFVVFSKLRISGIEYVMAYDIGSLYNTMVLTMENIRVIYKYTVVENMKCISNQLNQHPDS